MDSNTQGYFSDMLERDDDVQEASEIGSLTQQGVNIVRMPSQDNLLSSSINPNLNSTILDFSPNQVQVHAQGVFPPPSASVGLAEQEMEQSGESSCDDDDDEVSWDGVLGLVRRYCPDQAHKLVGDKPVSSDISGHSLISAQIQSANVQPGDKLGLKWSPSISNICVSVIDPKFGDKVDSKVIPLVAPKPPGPRFCMTDAPDALLNCSPSFELLRMVPDLTKSNLSNHTSISLKSMAGLETTTRHALAASSQVDILSTAAYNANREMFGLLARLNEMTMEECIEAVQGESNPLKALAVAATHVDSLLEASARAVEISSVSSISTLANITSINRQRILSKFPDSVSNQARFQLLSGEMSESILGGKGHLFGTKASRIACTEISQAESLEGPMGKVLHVMTKASERMPFRSTGTSQPSGRLGRRLGKFSSRGRGGQSGRRPSRGRGSVPSASAGRGFSAPKPESQLSVPKRGGRVSKRGSGRGRRGGTQ